MLKKSNIFLLVYGIELISKAWRKSDEKLVIGMGDEDLLKHMTRDGVDFASQGISTHSRSCCMGLKTKIKRHLLGHTIMPMIVVVFYLGNWNKWYKGVLYWSNKTKWQIWPQIFLNKPDLPSNFLLSAGSALQFFWQSRIKPNKIPPIFLTRQKCSFCNFPSFSISSPTNTYFTNIYLFLSFTLPIS